MFSLSPRDHREPAHDLGRWDGARKLPVLRRPQRGARFDDNFALAWA